MKTSWDRGTSATVAVAAVLCATGCPADGGQDGDGGSQTGETGETGMACPPEPTPQADGFASSEPIDSLPLNWRTYCDEEDFAGLASADPIGTVPLEFEIYHPETGGGWASGDFPIFIFSNGNNLYWNNYGTLHEQVVGAGYIVANIKSDTSSQTVSRGDRILCVSRLIANGGVSAEVLSHWDGRFVFAGASTGGEGAVYAARRYSVLGDASGPSDLIGIVAIAPSSNVPGSANLVGEELRSFFGIQGSMDGDVNDHVFGVYDAIQTEAVGAHVSKVIVYADSIRHADWGGCDPDTLGSCPSENADLLLANYLVAYLRWIGKSDHYGRELITGAPLELPPALQQPQMWPNSGGEPLVFRSFASGQEACGNQRVVVDSFSNFLTDTSDVFGTVSATDFDLLDEDAAGALTQTRHLTGALGVEWSSPGATLTWEVPQAYRSAVSTMDHFSFRLANMAEVGAGCEVLNEPLDVTVRLVDATGELAQISLGAYEREIPPPRPFATLAGDPCSWYDSMHTVRIPMSVFCDNNGNFDVTNVAQIELEFDQAIQGKAMIDSLEFNRALRDQGDACFD